VFKAVGALIVLAVIIGLLLGEQFAPDKISAAVESSRQQAANVNAQITRDQIVVPAKAAADAESIKARTAQQIAEDAHQQALRHQGELAAQAVSNTLQLNKVNADYQAAIASIGVQSEVEKASAQASMEERAAAARVATNFSVALSIAAIIVALGGSVALWTLLRNRARVSVLADDGLNQTLWINGKILYKTAQQLGESTIVEAPSLPERVIMLLTAASLARSQKSLAPLAELRRLNSITTTSSAQATNADLLKLNTVAVSGHIAAVAIQAQPAAAQTVARQSVQQASVQLAPADDLPELILLDDPAQRAHIEHVLEMSR